MRSTTDSAFDVTSRRRGPWAGAAWFQVARELKQLEEKRKFSVAETLRQGCANKYPKLSLVLLPDYWTLSSSVSVRGSRVSGSIFAHRSSLAMCHSFFYLQVTRL